MFDIKRSFGGRESTAKGLLVSIAATIAVSLSGCGGPEAPPPAPVLTEHIVDPSSTGALIDPSFGSHYAYPSDATSKGKLFVFFAASLSNPSQYQLIEKAAPIYGFAFIVGTSHESDRTLSCCGSVHRSKGSSWPTAVCQR